MIKINEKNLSKLKGASLSDLAKLLLSKIALTQEINQPELPTTYIHSYIYLSSLRASPSFKRQHHSSPFINKIITHAQAVQDNIDNQLGANENIEALPNEIIEIIIEISPSILTLYSIKFGNRSKNLSVSSQIKKYIIQQSNIYAVSNLVNLGLNTLSKTRQSGSYKDHLFVLKQLLIPAYFGSSSELNTKPILQAIKEMLLIHQNSNIQKELAKQIIHHYHQYWSQLDFCNSNMQHVTTLQNQLRLIEALHDSNKYSEDLVRSKLYKAHLKGLLQYQKENKAGIHLLAIKIFQKLADGLGQSNQTTQLFMNIFNILSSYGSHLIKDVWPSIYALIQCKQTSIFEPIQLVDIVFLKLQNHQNSNVIKNCVLQMLQNPNSNRIFQHSPSIIYNSVIRMLFLGVHYMDCMFHMDSKMYKLILSFFLRYYNSQQVGLQQLQRHLGWYLDQITANINYDHSHIALLQVFVHQKKFTNFLNRARLDKVKALLQNAYSRYPIRKRFQLVDSLLSLLHKNLRVGEVSIQETFDFLKLIKQEYQIEPNFQKVKEVLTKYNQQVVSLWVSQKQQEIIELVNQALNFIEVKQEIQTKIFGLLPIIKLYSKLFKLKQRKLTQYFSQILSQYGESMYKNKRQRSLVLLIYNEIKQILLAYMSLSQIFVKHLQAVLNLITLYSSIQSKDEPNLQCAKDIFEITHFLFYRVYTFNSGQDFRERQQERVVLARMLQWAYDKLSTEKLAQDILIQAMRARVQALNHKHQNPQLYVGYQILLEETLYELYSSINSQSASSLPIAKNKRLRFQTLLNTILTNDPRHKIHSRLPTTSDIRDFIDCYDFKRYEQICWFIEHIYRVAPVKTQEEACKLVKQIQFLLQSMIHNLQYGMGRKQIMAICECTISTMFAFAFHNKQFFQPFSQIIKQFLKVGQNYLIFHRAVSFVITKELTNKFTQLVSLKCQYFVEIILSILTIQQYRAYDSALYLYNDNNRAEFYSQFNSSLQRNYDGAIPRFLLIHVFHTKLIPQGNKSNFLFFDNLIHAAMNVCMEEVIKQKMFLSGKNKIKLQMWQFLLVFTPQDLLQFVGRQKLHKIILKCLDNISHNLISQIRYYSQMFLMRILLHPACYSLISCQIITQLQQGLIKSIGNVNRSIAYIVVSGLLIQAISKYGPCSDNFEEIKPSFIGLYNSLLTYVGSAVAYFRGLSQFFCLQKITGCLQTKYVSVLRQNYLFDPDAANMKDILNTIIQKYAKSIQTWEISQQILCKKPNMSNNVVFDQYYMDELKKVGAQLAKVTKNSDGFTAYRYIWRKNVANSIGETDEDLQKQEDNEAPAAEEQEEDIFQRKIDPTLDYLYGKEKKSHLKIMVVSAKSQALLGHLARTGEIFGLQQLIIPCKKVIEQDKFKSISVTSERWLNISDLGAQMGQNGRRNKIFSSLVRLKSQGYQVIKLSKNGRKQMLDTTFTMSKKCILLIDDTNCLDQQCSKFIDEQLQISRHFSTHVEASIFIWTYFKMHVHQ